MTWGDEKTWEISDLALEDKRNIVLTGCLSGTGWEPCGDGLWLKRRVSDPTPDICIFHEIFWVKKFPTFFDELKIIFLNAKPTHERRIQIVGYQLTPSGLVELRRTEWFEDVEGIQDQPKEQISQQLEGDGWRRSQPDPYCLTLSRPSK